ncbi:MAG: hypothetical protein HYR51_17060 [Candidatus Rokubacteria bacterium]|nr:hypothetical protein [Candidatus Rokubacteria bacterium]
MPTAAEERDLARSRWRRMPLAAEIVFFVLTAVAVVALFALCYLWRLPRGWITAVVAIGAAEWLIHQYRFWRTGVESALWIGGLVAFIAALPRSGAPEAVLVFAAAAALAGWRLRNAVFGTAAVVLVIAYPAARDWTPVALLAGVAIGLAAAIATTHVWPRPSTAWLFGAVAVAGPVAAFAAARGPMPWRLGTLPVSDVAVIVLFLALAALDVAIGVRFRVRAPLIAAPVSIALAIVEAHDFIAVSLEAELIVLGLVTLATAGMLMRALRGRTSGIVSTKVEKPELADAVQTVSMLGMAAPGGRAGEPANVSPPERGGRFGGGGAGGRY